MSQPKAFGRLLDLALALKAGGRVGVTTGVLIEKVEYKPGDAGKRALMRDLDSLREVGLEIENAADLGEDARYVLRPGDVRLRVEFTPEQRSALQAAVATATADGLVAVQRQPPPVDLDLVREGVNARCLMRFHYNGTDREVDPQTWQWSGNDLVVTGWDRGSQKIKSFAVIRMQNLSIGPPGSAEIPADVERPGLDPITWQVDPPVTAVLWCPGYAQDTIALLGGSAVDDEVHVEVTNRLVFLARVLELGSRVKLVGPEELRQELRALLEVAR